MKNLRSEFPFKVTVQTVLESKHGLPLFEKKLALLHDLGFWGLELNLPDLSIISPTQLKELLARYDLTLTYLATGIFAQKRGLSLSSGNQQKRAESILGAVNNINYAREMDAGVIFGFFKGGPTADHADSLGLFKDSIRQICAQVKPFVPVLIEATNSRETCVIRNLSEAEDVCRAINHPSLYILPDTCHMYYEEQDPLQAIRHCFPQICNIHISEENRLFPGLGHIDFFSLFELLAELNYHGTLGIEGNLQINFEDDICRSAEYLCSLKLHNK